MDGYLITAFIQLTIPPPPNYINICIHCFRISGYYMFSDMHSRLKSSSTQLCVDRLHSSFFVKNILLICFLLLSLVTLTHKTHLTSSNKRHVITQLIKNHNKIIINIFFQLISFHFFSLKSKSCNI